MGTKHQLYPSDVSDAEWEFLVPYLTLMRPDAPQREYSLRDVFEQVSIQQLADGRLPDAVTSRTADEDAWQPH